MKIHGAVFFAVVVMMSVSTEGFADIYKSKDAEGNTVFTDVPTADAKEVNIQPTNTADAPPDIPHPPPTQKKAGAAAPVSQQEQQGDVTIIGDANNDRLERAVEEHRRQEVRDTVEHHGEGEPLRRTPPAAQPHHGGGARR